MGGDSSGEGRPDDLPGGLPPLPAPPARVRLAGRLISWLALRAPWAWPLLRGRVGAFFGGRAPGWAERTGAGTPAHLAPLAAAVLLADREPERVLDVGCGTGESTLFLAREFPGARVRGVDLAPEMVSRARSRIGLDPEARVAFREADAAELPFPVGSFDLVCQIDVPLFASELVRVMRPGATVVVASSRGARTPFHIPERVVSRRLGRLGVTEVAIDTAPGGGTWYAGRLRGDGPQ